MIPLRDLGSPAVALEWHEAVAVVAALTTTLWNVRASQAPTLDAAVLTPDGEVEVRGDGRLAGAITSGLAMALGALLESTPCPTELRRIVNANLGPSPELDSVTAFGQALLFFERPGRSDVLRDLATRAAVALERARAAAELERLTERARHRAEHAATPAAPPEPPPPPTPGRRLTPVAVGLTVFAGMAVAAATLATIVRAPSAASGVSVGPVADDEVEPSGPAASPAPAVAGAADVEPARTGAGRTGGSGSAAPRPGIPAAAGPSAAPTETRATPPQATASPGAPAAGRAPADPRAEITVKVAELGGAPVAPPGTAGSTARGTTRIYTAADSGVSPAILVKPHLPAEPPADVPPWEVGTLELTVGLTGAVEQVHLISPYNRYQERMLVAAAKAWLFQPATKDGRPVRFRTRIRVTL